MRKIKFRFVDTKLKTVRYGKPLHNDFEHPEIIPQQFIGLKDKNGIEIYEGDELIDFFEEDDMKHISFLPVVWCDKQLMWCVDASFKKDGSYLTSLVDYFGNNLEINKNK